MQLPFRFIILSCIGLLAPATGFSQSLAPMLPGGLQPSSAMKPEAPRAKPARVVNRIAATVNGRPITSSEVSFRLMPIGAQLATQYPRQGAEFNRQLAAAKKAIINDLIDRELVLSEFDSKGAQLKDSYVDQEISRIIRENFNGNRDRFLESLRLSNMTIRNFREVTKRNMVVMAMRASKYDQDIPPTPDEINREYQETKMKFRDITKDHIQFKKIFIPMLGDEHDSTPDVQLKLAELVAQEIRSGKSSFEEMAKTYSKDGMAENGGVWPMKERSELSPEFAAIIFDTPENQLVGPLIEPTGFTIAVPLKKNLAPAPPLSKIKDEIDAQVRSKRSNERYKQWIERLRNKAIIKTYI
ncbi:SurA N-terminal domain-containing protein [Akkermansia sp. N21116]|uniref:SurA N-terminal domain-containing protein n=1 Tax=Akkermansia sp. N21116 TaxID=3040764 RepID=UPI00244EE65A|nr:SurA N-terminal domain-containing protein [Akkermansia sp. N21116]WPX39267.1 SurA N-terminal domain-containing protein [Akkermansia sp. N21116]